MSNIDGLTGGAADCGDDGKTHSGSNGGAADNADGSTFGGGVDELIRIGVQLDADPELDDFRIEYEFEDAADPDLTVYYDVARRRSAPKFQKLVDEYVALWSELAIRRSKEARIKSTIERIVAARRAYEVVEGQTGVPWYVVAAIHNLESTLDFRTHLHNGDPLTGRTVRVPAGRPRSGNPPVYLDGKRK